MDSTQTTFLSKNLSMPDLMRAVVKQSYIIDYGVVKKVVADGIVQVAVSVATSGRDIVVMNCILAGFTSKAFTLNIKPNEGDKVMVFYPRRYDSKMFDPEQEDILVNSYATGYSTRTGIAVLLGQKRDDTHLNLLEIEDTGALSYQLAEKDVNNNVHVTSDFELSTDGAISYSIKKADGNNDKQVVGFDISSQGALTYSIKDTDTEEDKATLTISASGEATYTVKNVSKTKVTLTIGAGGNVSLTSAGTLEITTDGAITLQKSNDGGKLVIGEQS